ncbi:hypothetical protein [Vreelandella boliviensis]|uniref:DUF4145 domain-containing protein n=1 Tax=Vreelandella boliviensis LC1 TaxID=1072583 RepID=A0A265DW02_9GAMM|nr:hypothetical protein [Halomonas boliviensis]EHJ92083.1 hypothetical protein KUC_2028 [Halomonas boliviensis LC1]OZT73497.1 hypothetical protein CE457_14305 [Halomonas boliviensis LC1]
MKNSDNFKTVWWGVLVILIGYYLFGRYASLIEGNPSYFDVVVFLVWVGVCLAPIFQEMDIFGVKLKQKIDDLNKDLNHQLSILKTEIKSSIDVVNANSNQIYFQNGGNPPKDSEIPNISQEIQRTLRKMGIATSQDSEEDFEVDPVHLEMFKVRLSFENLLRKYAGYEGEYRRRYSVGRMLNDLQNSEAVSKQVLHGVTEVISVCNYAVHGEPITKTQIAFVRESAPGLLKALSKELKGSKHCFKSSISPTVGL